MTFSSNVAATFIVDNNTNHGDGPGRSHQWTNHPEQAGMPRSSNCQLHRLLQSADAISIDDGSVESANGFGNGAYYVNRLTPATYPATLTQVALFWAGFQGFPPGTAINVVAGANPGGTTNINGTSLQSFATTSGALGVFTTYTLPNPVTISSGDFVVGFQVPTDPGFGIAVDTNTSANRSYTSGNGTTFAAFADPGNFMIRAAQVFTGCGAGGSTPCTSFSQNFDSVTAPALPAGWVATNASGPAPLWVTSTTTPDTAPNAAFVDDPTVTSDKDLDTPGILITSAAQVTFRHSFNLERDASNFYDGGVLEVSSPNINGGAFTDITNAAVGGNFVSGGYVGTISNCCGSALTGRMAWSGDSGGYITTVANLGPNVVGQTIKLRFRMGSDSSEGVTGWRIDSLAVTTTGSVHRRCKALFHGRSTAGPAPLISTCRSPATPASSVASGGGANNYQLVFTFPGAVTFTGATVSTGTGSVGGTSGSGTNTATVNLTGVTNVQKITVKLLGVSDGVNTGDISVQMRVLVGDTTGNGSVNAGDVTQTKAQSGQPVTAANFRQDVTANGTINASDVTSVKIQSGTAVP